MPPRAERPATLAALLIWTLISRFVYLLFQLWIILIDVLSSEKLLLKEARLPLAHLSPAVRRQKRLVARADSRPNVFPCRERMIGMANHGRTECSA